MKAKIAKDFNVLFSENLHFEYYEEEDLSYFLSGDVVDVLKVVEDSSFESGKALVIFNPSDNSVAVVDKFWLEIEE